MDRTLSITALMNSGLSALWASSRPAFLWFDPDSCAVWANRSGLALWGASSISDLRKIGGFHPALQRQLHHVAEHLPSNARRLERLRFYVRRRDFNPLFQCCWMRLGEIPLVFVQSQNTDLPLGVVTSELDLSVNAKLLLDGMDTAPFIALSSKGEVIFSTASALTLLASGYREHKDPLSSPLTDSSHFRPVTRLIQTLSLEHPAARGHIPISGSSLQVEWQSIALSPDAENLIIVYLYDAPDQEKAEEVSPLINRNPGSSSLWESPPSVVCCPTVISDKLSEKTVSAQNENSSKEQSAQNPDAAPDSEPVSPLRSDKNIFHFTGIPLRIQNNPDLLEMGERKAFREIARALGARIEGEPLYNPSEEKEKFPASPYELLTLLDRVSNGLLIYRDNQPLYANQKFLTMMGYSCLEDIKLISIQDLLLNITGGEAGLPSSSPSCSFLGKMGFSARLQSVFWGEEQAMLINLHDAPSNHARESDQFYVPLSDLSPDHEANLILNLASDGIIPLDAQGCILSLDDKLQKLLGYQKSDHVGKQLATLFPASQRALIAGCWEAVFRQDSTTTGFEECRLSIPSATNRDRRAILLRIARLVIGNAEPRYRAILQDMGSTSISESELIEARHAAEEASAQKSQFLAKISHEIRTPLNAIIGFSEIIIEEQFDGIENTRYRNYIRDIQASGKHLLCLVNDLLDISKIEAGRFELEKTHVNVNEVVRHSIDVLHAEALRKKVIIRRDLARSLPHILVDRRSLHQILLNLLSNAIKFNKKGGQILVSTSLKDCGEVRIHVRDTGIGMTPGQLEIALESFRQAHISSPEQVIMGTGLGLPLSKALIEANNGTFSLTSDPKLGTLAEITFPVSPAIPARLAP